MSSLYLHKQLFHKAWAIAGMFYSVLLALMCCFTKVYADTEEPPPADRFHVSWSDATTDVGQEVHGWTNDSDKEDECKIIRAAGEEGLNGKRLFDSGTPARMVRDTTLSALQSGPYIEFANGDILPGRIVNPPEDIEPPLSDETLLLVELADPLRTKDRKNIVWIRSSSVSRIVVTPVDKSFQTPGRVVYRDGRELRAKSIRWRADGVDILLDRTITALGWDAFAELNVPGVDRFSVLNDDLRPSTEEIDESMEINPTTGTNRIARLILTSGAIFTINLDRTPRFTYRYGSSLNYDIKPAWAASRMIAPISNFVVRYYCAQNEIPLGLLPYEVLAARSIIGYDSPIQFNRSVRGDEPAIGPFEGGQAICMQAYRAMSFDLPPNIQGFTSWVGIDRAAGRGGCVRCLIFKDDMNGKPIWSSNLIRGGEPAVPIRIDNLAGAKRLILVADCAENDHPPDADPLDIRDEVDWIFPYVQVIPPEPLPEPEVGEP